MISSVFPCRLSYRITACSQSSLPDFLPLPHIFLEAWGPKLDTVFHLKASTEPARKPVHILVGLRFARCKVTLTCAHLVLHLNSQILFCRTAAWPRSRWSVSSVNQSCHLSGLSRFRHLSVLICLLFSWTTSPRGQDYSEFESWPKASLLVVSPICRFDTVHHPSQA